MSRKRCKPEEIANKLRFTLSINDRGNKTRLTRYQMGSASGLMNQHQWVDAIHDQLLKVRPVTAAKPLIEAVDAVIAAKKITWTT